MGELKNQDKPAFACVDTDYLQEGLTKREYFAAKAMQAFITKQDAAINFEHLSQAAVDAADALIVALASER